MQCYLSLLKSRFFIVLSFALLHGSVWAEPVWHCSRSDVQIADASDNFTLAALNFEREVIRLSLRDLYAVYQGIPVKLSGGVPLSACIAGHDMPLTAAALNSIGAKPAVVKALATSNQTFTNNLHIVQDEQSMQACIAKHHPAIGYLSQAKHTEAVGPCF